MRLDREGCTAGYRSAFLSLQLEGGGPATGVQLIFCPNWPHQSVPVSNCVHLVDCVAKQVAMRLNYKQSPQKNVLQYLITLFNNIINGFLRDWWGLIYPKPFDFCSNALFNHPLCYVIIIMREVRILMRLLIFPTR